MCSAASKAFISTEILFHSKCLPNYASQIAACSCSLLGRSRVFDIAGLLLKCCTGPGRPGGHFCSTNSFDQCATFVFYPDVGPFVLRNDAGLCPLQVLHFVGCSPCGEQAPEAVLLTIEAYTSPCTKTVPRRKCTKNSF